MRVFGAFISMLLFGLSKADNQNLPFNIEKKSCQQLIKSDDDLTIISEDSENSTCIQFTVGQGTGCDWMCNYCANQLGTTNYYFTDSVCVWQSTGCTGNPVAGKTYTCCKANEEDFSPDLDEMIKLIKSI